MVGLVDCNNFFVSCERVFNPSLEGRPVVILSNNDGCVISRSNEAKALGIRMGMPFFQARPWLERHRVAVFSSNYALYGDMSRRVMQLLGDLVPSLDVCSIDEAFVSLEGLDETARQELAARTVALLRRGTGIPVTFGMAPTRTLAKVAARFGKRFPAYRGVCAVDTEEKRRKSLALLPVEDVWGVGRRYAQQWQAMGVRTAAELAALPRELVRRRMTVAGERVWMELNGTPVRDEEDGPDREPLRQSICTSRSFPDPGVSDPAEVEEAVANFAASCVRKLRSRHGVCSGLSVFAWTGRNASGPYCSLYRNTLFEVPADTVGEIVPAALDALRKEWRQGPFRFRKAGVLLWGISDARFRQGSLFDGMDRVRMETLQRTLDTLNRRIGPGTVRLAVQGVPEVPAEVAASWRMRADYRSPAYTTEISDIIRIRGARTED